MTTPVTTLIPRRKMDFAMPGLGLGMLGAGILLALLTNERHLAVYAMLGLSMACFATAAWQSWTRRAAPHGPALRKEPAIAAAPRLAAAGNESSLQLPPVASVAAAAPVPAVGDKTPVEPPAVQRAPDLQVLLHASVADLLQAALLKDPAAVGQLRQMLAELPSPADAPHANSSAAVAAPAA